MNFLLQYNWELFIAAEVLSVVALLLFGFTRYWFIQGRTSYLFIGLFLLLLVLEALLGLYVYQQTGRFQPFSLSSRCLFSMPVPLVFLTFSVWIAG